VQVHITSNDGVPIYLQIVTQVKYLVASGRLGIPQSRRTADRPLPRRTRFTIAPWCQAPKPHHHFSKPGNLICRTFLFCTPFWTLFTGKKHGNFKKSFKLNYLVWRFDGGCAVPGT
jgi:hypothetical protein